MKASKKRGFTIIELVIVIAVIAILAAVLIPTFSNVIQKAKEANDTIMVKRINEALTSDAILKGAKHANMTEALNAAFDRGYDLTKIRSTANDNEILWDSVSDCFVYMKGNEITYIPDSKDSAVSTADKWNYFRIVDTAAEVASSDYSTYLAGNDVSGDITAKAGFDAGNNTKIAKVTVSSEGHNILVRTNGGDLAVTANTGSVAHYGNATKITVDGTYNEYGGAKQITVTNGTLTTQSSSVVMSIVSQPTEGKTVTVDVSKKVVEVVVTSEYESATTVIGTTAVTESKTIVNALNEAKKYSKDGSKVPAGFAIDTTNQTITIKDAVALMYYGYVFDVDAALQYDMNHGINQLKSMWNNQGTYQKGVSVYLDADIDLDGAILERGMNTFGFLFDGNGHTIKNVSIVDNTTIIGTGSDTWRQVGLFKQIRSYLTVKDLTLENVNITTSANGVVHSSAGILAGSASGIIENITIKNSNVSGGKYTGGVVGYAYANITNCQLTDCSVSGQYKMGGVVGYICAQNDPITDAKGVIIEQRGTITKVNNNTLSDVVVEVGTMMSGKNTADMVVGKIVGNFNGSDPNKDNKLNVAEGVELIVKGECKNNTFMGTCDGDFIARIESQPFNFTVEQSGNK